MFFQLIYIIFVPDLIFCFKVAVTTTCANTVLSSDRSIHSPNFPHKLNKNEMCTWAIIAPSGKQVQIKFRDFRLEPSKDSLIIYDGPSKNSAMIQKLNGTSLPTDVISTGNSLFLEFKSDENKYYNGFNLKYSIKGTLIQMTLR